jgi:uncharacterized protein DUF6328
MNVQQRRDERSDGGGSKGETQKQRVDRELIELLNELRVTLPGVQVLFAFLLIVPFSEGFAHVSPGQRAWYFTSFIATAGAAVLLVAPASHHRLRFREGDKEWMVRTANRLAIAGMILLAVAIASAAFLVTDVLFTVPWASAVAAALAAAMAWIWFGVPLVHRDRSG